MDRQVIWTAWQGEALEHLQVSREGFSWFADGTVAGVHDGRPYRLHYAITCDRDWRIRQLSVELFGKPPLRLRADGQGNWSTALAEPLPAFEGCLDVDIALTPFTNTLPIRRLRLAKDADADVPVVYVPAPDLEPTRVEQRYVCLEPGDWGTRGGRYQYQQPADGFDAELAVDADGLVVDYPDLFRRLYPSDTYPAVETARPVPDRIPGIDRRDGLDADR